ncbi:hypothetical protein L484_006882 [Morus notabilis]|uniref:HMA domain-containing protein n=1 Tax=Morus notabilis TaxID=981085 RepID=W9SL24_9ROSA|nr:uncharacterized protein LOC21390297 [Morus notabilis]EXC15618.1 hypothetical protein L484_006882 [Morus notabilis]
MTKQKVVIKVSLNDRKSRTKAIKTAVGVDGVTQAALQADKDQIEVTGEGIDVVCLATLLRKSLKYAEVVSVTAVDEKKEAEKKKEEEMKKELEAAQKLIWPYTTPMHCYYQVPDHGCVSYVQPQYDPPCSIM